MSARTGGWRWIRGHRYARVRITKSLRPTIPLSACSTDEEADARAALIAEVANKLIAGGRADRVRHVCEQLGEATSAKHLEVIQKAADRFIATGAVAPQAITVKEFARQWTSGELHRRFPDYVRAKNSKGDEGILKKHILPHVASVPLAAFRLEEAKLVMSHVPLTASRATRRHVAQVMNRLLNMAVYPAEILKATPLPKGFLPKLGGPKAKPYLYPAEDAKLMRCTAIPLERRLVWGMLAREGMRAGELLGSHAKGDKRDPLTWGDLDLTLGALNLDKNKTNDPRAWALDKGVVAALVDWRKLNAKAKLSDPVFPTPIPKLAEQLRDDLTLAGVDRAELGERDATRSWMKAHHLRGTFVTLALANGKTETWVQDRTGHTSSTMINAYRRTARTAAELGIGVLKPLVQALPEFAAAKAKRGATQAEKEGGAKVGQSPAVSEPREASS